jgi:hypothetical protein
VDRRRKLLVALVAAVAAAFIADKAYAALWSGPWSRVNDEITRVEGEIEKAELVLKRKETALEGWKKINALLSKPRTPDVKTHFISHFGQICERVGLNLDITPTAGAGQAQGDFKEYVFEMRFKLTWAQFVDLLVELHNSREFLKPIRIGITSQYEKEDRLDLDLKVSTIEYAPVPQKTGAK